MNASLHISIVQTEIHWEDKEANLAMLEKKIMDYREKTEVIFLPEMFSTGFSMNLSLAEPMTGPTVQWMQKLAIARKVIIAGSMIIKEGQDHFNRLVWMLPNGQYGYYDKRHLFAFAEEDKFYQAGKKRLIASVKGWRINLLVCYDLRFPAWSRQKTKNGEPEYDVLAYVANWPERRALAWKTLLQARAIENQCYVIGVNRVGDDGKQIHYAGESMVIDPAGEVLYIKKEVEDIFTIELSSQKLKEVRERFPFLKDADAFDIT